MDEKELIDKTLEGDEKAFEQLVKNHRDQIFHHCLDIVKQSAAAEDIVQEAFIHAYQHLKNFNRRSSFYTWLFRIAHNLALNYLKKESRRHEIEEKMDVAPSIDRAQFKELLPLLPYKQRIVFEMYYIDQLTQKEIGKKLGIAHGTVRSRLHYARAYLKLR